MNGALSLTDDVQRVFAESMATPRVVAGPFRGVRCLPDTGDAGWLDRSLGGFDLELHPVIERVCAGRPDVVVTLGDETGYYTAGMAVRLPEARVAAFAVTDAGHQAQRALVRLNGLKGVVGRVSLHRGPETPLLDGTLRSAGSGALLICNDPVAFAGAMASVAAPALIRAWVIARAVGTPDRCEGLSGTLAATHSVETVRGFASGADGLPEPWCEVKRDLAVPGGAGAAAGEWRVFSPAGVTAAAEGSGAC